MPASAGQLGRHSSLVGTEGGAGQGWNCILGGRAAGPGVLSQENGLVGGERCPIGAEDETTFCPARRRRRSSQEMAGTNCVFTCLAPSVGGDREAWKPGRAVARPRLGEPGCRTEWEGDERSRDQGERAEREGAGERERGSVQLCERARECVPAPSVRV